MFYHAFAGFDGPDHTEMVGQTWVVGSRIDNLHLAHLWAWVPPRFGRRGHGAALVAYAEQHLREIGRRTAVSQTWIGDGDGGYRPFAERQGYSLAQTQVERRQPLPMDEATLARLEAEAARHSEGYTLRTVLGPIPDDLVPGFLTLYNLMNVEMPTGDIELEEGRRTPEVQAQQEDELREQGRTRLTVLAYSPAGEAVAYSNVVTGSTGNGGSDDPGIDQWATIVRPDHRGHRLGAGREVRPDPCGAGALPRGGVRPHPERRDQRPHGRGSTRPSASRSTRSRASSRSTWTSPAPQRRPELGARGGDVVRRDVLLHQGEGLLGEQHERGDSGHRPCQDPADPRLETRRRDPGADGTRRRATCGTGAARTCG